MVNDTTLITELAAILQRIAPDADLETLGPEADLREELDIDSMDFMRFAAAIQERLGVTVPQADQAELTTLRRAARYVEGRRHVA
jgi:acyl carrier protein